LLNGAAGSGTERRLGEEVGSPRRASMAGGGAAPGGEDKDEDEGWRLPCIVK